MFSVRRRSLNAAALLAVCTGFAPAVWAAAAVGQPAPDFSLPDTTGKPVRLFGYRGKTVVLEWTNPGCPFVRKHYDSGNMGATQKLAREQGVVWLSINSTAREHADYLPPPQLAAWLKERHGMANAVLMDEEGTAGRAYDAKTTPHMVIIDAQGALVYQGAIDSIASAQVADIDKAINYVKAALADMAAGRPIAHPVTRAYGCSVKYKNDA
jgi:peroxiredoxin